MCIRKLSLCAAGHYLSPDQPDVVLTQVYCACACGPFRGRACVGKHRQAIKSDSHGVHFSAVGTPQRLLVSVEILHLTVSYRQICAISFHGLSSYKRPCCMQLLQHVWSLSRRAMLHLHQ